MKMSDFIIPPRTYADQLSAGVVQAVVELMWKQLGGLLEHKPSFSSDNYQTREYCLSFCAKLCLFTKILDLSIVYRNSGPFHCFPKSLDYST